MTAILDSDLCETTIDISSPSVTVCDLSASWSGTDDKLTLTKVSFKTDQVCELQVLLLMLLSPFIRIILYWQLLGQLVLERSIDLLHYVHLSLLLHCTFIVNTITLSSW